MILNYTSPKTDQMNRIESAIERLTEISGDLKSMIAVHESRISQQEKYSEELYSAVEMRRIELENRTKEMYAVMKEKDNEILKQLEEMRNDISNQNKKLNERMNQMEKYIWMAVGGVTVISWAVSIASQYFKLLIH